MTGTLGLYLATMRAVLPVVVNTMMHTAPTSTAVEQAEEATLSAAVTFLPATNTPLRTSADASA